MQARLRRFLPLFTLLLLLFTLPSPQQASTLSLSISPLSLDDTAGSTVIFVGTITNTTGASLNASDLFLNFGNYDLSAFSDITQLLGTPDFTIPNNTFTAPVDLFSITLSPSALSRTYSIDVSLEDVNNDLSNTVTVDVVASGGTATATPELPTYFLACAGFVGIAFSLGLISLFRRQWFAFQIR